MHYNNPHLYGESFGNIGEIYKSPYRIQKGRALRYYYAQGQGLGSVFRGVLHFLTPLIKSGSKAVGKELLRSGTELLENMDTQTPMKDLLKRQSNKALSNLRMSALDKIKSFQSGQGLRAIKRKDIDFDQFITSMNPRSNKGKFALKIKPRKIEKRRESIASTSSEKRVKTGKKPKSKKKTKSKKVANKKAFDIFS
jgi:hypothetical protein